MDEKEDGINKYPELMADDRKGLEAGSGLEIEGAEETEDVAGSLPETETDFETPAWLKTGGVDELAPEGVASETEDKESAWVEIDAEFWAEEGENVQGPGSQVQTDTSGQAAESEEGKEDARKLIVVKESQRTRKTLIVIAAVAACICVVSTYMFSHGIGPFAPIAPAVPAEEGLAAPQIEAETVEWATAGEGYKALFSLILKQTNGSNEMPTIGLGTDLNDLSLDLDDSRMTDNGFGQDMADIIASDGTYIYGINNMNLFIAQAEGDRIELVSKIAQPPVGDNQVYFEMYLAGDRLAAIRHGLDQIDYPFGGHIIDTSIDIFDISNRKTPVKLHTLTQSGEFLSSSIAGEYIYLITTYYGDVSKMDGGDPRTFVPLFSRDGEQYIPGENDIYLPPGSMWPCYTVISGIDVADAGDFVSLKAVYGDIGTIYTSPEAVYLTRTAYEETKEPAGELPLLPGEDGPSAKYVMYTNWSETLISKLKLGAGRVESVAQAQVSGYVLNQFSMDEYKGVLRLVTTVANNIWYGFKNTDIVYNADDWARLPTGETDTANALYVLDEDLIQISVNEDIAQGDRIYSCRFWEDNAYFVPFRQTAPLLSADLSDPYRPKAAGVLELQGLPDYLFPYEDGRLFGLGRDIDPETGFRQGMKLTMLDNSEPSDVKELHSLSLKDDFAAAEHNIKAILVNADKSIVAFPTNSKYLMYGYDPDDGFKKVAELGFSDGDGAWPEVRGLFFGDVFYIIDPNNIKAYDVDKGFDIIGNLQINEGAGAADRWDFSYSKGLR